MDKSQLSERDICSKFIQESDVVEVSEQETAECPYAG
jgi:hypothetical protein